jgi:hypothetical protein
MKMGVFLVMRSIYYCCSLESLKSGIILNPKVMKKLIKTSIWAEGKRGLHPVIEEHFTK